MTPEEVAQRNSIRTGYRLIDYAECALPAYLVKVEAITLERRPLPVLEEFALKAVAAGLTTVAEVSGLLGIDERVMRTTLVGLSKAEQVTLTGGAGTRTHVLKLTAKGTRTLAEVALTVPEQQTIPVVLDGLTKSVASWRTFDLIRPKDVAPMALLEIPTMFVKRPTEGDIEISEVQRYINRFTADDVKRDVLAIKRVERSERKYLPAVALFFLENDGDDVQVAFAVDGRLDPAHEAAFAQGGGVERLRLKESIRKGRAEAGTIQSELMKIVRKFPRADAAGGLARDVEQRRATVADLEQSQESLPSAVVDAEVASALKGLDTAAEKLQSEPAVSLTCYQHPAILASALRDAKRRLLIVSPWITPGVVNGRFIDALRALLQRGVDVYIAYGLGDDRTNSEEPIRRLEELAADFPTFRLKRVGNTHSKILIRDDDTCVVSSFNWLSFKVIRIERFAMSVECLFARKTSCKSSSKPSCATSLNNKLD